MSQTTRPKTKIPNELEAMTVEGYVAESATIFDENKNKTQRVINQELYSAISNVDSANNANAQDITALATRVTALENSSGGGSTVVTNPLTLSLNKYAINASTDTTVLVTIGTSGKQIDDLTLNIQRQTDSNFIAISDSEISNNVYTFSYSGSTQPLEGIVNFKLTGTYNGTAWDKTISLCIIHEILYGLGDLTEVDNDVAYFNKKLSASSKSTYTLSNINSNGYLYVLVPSYIVNFTSATLNNYEIPGLGSNTTKTINNINYRVHKSTNKYSITSEETLTFVLS